MKREEKKIFPGPSSRRIPRTRNLARSGRGKNLVAEYPPRPRTEFIPSVTPRRSKVLLVQRLYRIFLTGLTPSNRFARSYRAGKSPFTSSRWKRGFFSMEVRFERYYIHRTVQERVNYPLRISKNFLSFEFLLSSVPGDTFNG